MAKKKSNTPNVATLIVVGLIAFFGIVFILFSVQQTAKGPGTTESNASYTTTLTQGDDVISLEQDLDILNIDRTTDEEVHLNSIQ
jgi:phosphatidylglycerophosphate synthase